MLLGRILAWGLMLIGASSGCLAQSERGTAGLAIVGTTVLPMEGADRLRDQTVLVEGDRIVRVGPQHEVRVPASWQVIDGRGQTLMPGLVDMHIHLSPEPGRPGDATQRALAVSLAHGVTTVRTMAGQANHIAVRDAIERGTLAGPRLYAAAPAIHDKNAPDEATARAAVSAAKSAGFDLIKSHHLTRPTVWQAVQDEARRLGLPTAGHVSNEIGLYRAVEAGQQIEHLDGTLLALLPDGAPERTLDFAQFPTPPVLDAVARASDAGVAALAWRLARAKSWHVPTLSLFEKIADVTTPTGELRKADAMRFVPDAALDAWAKQRDAMIRSGPDAAAGRSLVETRRRIAAALHRAGVPMMIGSDTAQAFHVWGPAVIEEMEALERAGVPRMEVLRNATIVPRDYFRSLPNGGSALGWKADFGTVTPGARADLLLIDGDPSADLGALRRIKAVIAAGHVYERPGLDAMLAKAGADAKAQAAKLAGPTVYVMRHLQRGAGEDPGLTAEGRRNAEALIGIVGAEPPSAIYVTATRRARETATPLAAKLGLTVKEYAPADMNALAASVAAENGNVLIVGHSNTVPEIIRTFGASGPPALSENRYGDLWRISGPEKKTELLGIGR